jgi:hypothetical protein
MKASIFWDMSCSQLEINGRFGYIYIYILYLQLEEEAKQETNINRWQTHMVPCLIYPSVLKMGATS